MRGNRKSIRLKGYDYSQSGGYFVTICTQNRECLFGVIENDEMVLNDAGKAANKYWNEISAHYPNVILDIYVVMPNHVHGIIFMMNDMNDVGVNDYSPLRSPLQRPRGTSKTIGAVVRGFKIGVTKWMRNNSRVYDVWQRNYYEHIIRDENDLNCIRQYVMDNPKQWIKDENYVKQTKI